VTFFWDTVYVVLTGPGQLTTMLNNATQYSTCFNIGLHVAEFNGRPSENCTRQVAPITLYRLLVGCLTKRCSYWAWNRITYSPPIILRREARICANVGRCSAASFQQDLTSSTSGFPSSVVSGSWGRYGMLSPLRTRFTTSVMTTTTSTDVYIDSDRLLYRTM